VAAELSLVLFMEMSDVLSELTHLAIDNSLPSVYIHLKSFIDHTWPQVTMTSLTLKLIVHLINVHLLGLVGYNVDVTEGLQSLLP
jgi:hypothetical protein